MTPNDTDKILDILEKAHARVEELQAQAVHQQAMIHAVLLCLRDCTHADPKQLEKAFTYYQELVHQELLEIVEDHDAFLATRLDKRPPE